MRVWDAFPQKTQKQKTRCACGTLSHKKPKNKTKQKF